MQDQIQWHWINNRGGRRISDCAPGVVNAQRNCSLCAFTAVGFVSHSVVLVPGFGMHSKSNKHIAIITHDELEEVKLGPTECCTCFSCCDWSRSLFYPYDYETYTMTKSGQQEHTHTPPNLATLHSG